MESEPSSKELRWSPKTTIHGVPCFVNDRYLFSPAFHTLGLASSASKVGWRKALSSLPKDLRDYIISPRRTSFTPLLGIKNGSRILDLGAGWGSVSFQLAKGFPNITVYALDKTVESLLFLQVVKDQEKLYNLKIMHGDAYDIPVIDEFFDHVIMMGVLEWIGESVRFKEPQEAQLEVLRELLRVLKSKGSLLLGIENRVGYQYLLGEADHWNLKYTSLMPRFLANLYCKVRVGKPYRTYTYTESGYRKLLASVGFRHVKMYVAFRNYPLPLYISDLSSVKHMVKAIFEKSGKRSLKIALATFLPNRILRLFVPAYFLLAVK